MIGVHFSADPKSYIRYHVCNNCGTYSIRYTAQWKRGLKRAGSVMLFANIDHEASVIHTYTIWCLGAK
jgi:hypothetical protein